ncbi:hypothetical protein FPSE_09566 [Fusarium pseudograminearum CS3096]|uniref:Uncharacterized protein n=1 Tax=Fusarium pseudograminearum (strain CS3096) TaxID=1028729 RepID=K3VA75_FUSPC|nr:hypothetical protein FPSE_09566 [Fusarium pseudograminearum CS3096]EKJ70349.1 hypothetical protein FPSE_09566 [Fusarium pseudograminearum CS3096]
MHMQCTVYLQMNNLQHVVIFLGLWGIQGSFGRILPDPTQASQAWELDRPPSDPIHTTEIRDLVKREDTSSSIDPIIVTIAPDETCGFLSGRPALPITCENQRPYNPLYLLCTNESAPYCGTYEFPQGIEDYRCSSTPATRVSTASFTYIGQENANFVTTTLNVAESVSQSSSTESESTASNSSTIPSSTSPPSDTSPSKSPPSSKSNLGAIIGGAVGGFAALSLVLFGIAWFLRQSRKKNRQSIQVNPMEQDPLSDPNIGKPDPRSPVPSDWRGSTVTALSSPYSASPQVWMNHPMSPSAQSDMSQAMSPTLGEHLAYEMSGESAQPPHEMGDTRVYEMAGDNDHRMV